MAKYIIPIQEDSTTTLKKTELGSIKILCTCYKYIHYFFLSSFFHKSRFNSKYIFIWVKKIHQTWLVPKKKFLVWFVQSLVAAMLWESFLILRNNKCDLMCDTVGVWVAVKCHQRNPQRVSGCLGVRWQLWCISHPWDPRNKGKRQKTNLKTQCCLWCWNYSRRDSGGWGPDLTWTQRQPSDDSRGCWWVGTRMPQGHRLAGHLCYLAWIAVFSQYL